VQMQTRLLGCWTLTCASTPGWAAACTMCSLM
jgi:hypothetical protein